MRTLFVTEFISLDGVVEAPGGEESYKHTGWTFDIDEDPTMYEFKGEETFGTETLLLGRTTYEGFSEAWTRARGRVRRQVQHHGEGRRVDHPAGPDLGTTPPSSATSTPYARSRRATAARSRSPAAPRWPSPCTRPAWSTSGT